MSPEAAALQGLIKDVQGKLGTAVTVSLGPSSEGHVRFHLRTAVTGLVDVPLRLLEGDPADPALKLAAYQTVRHMVAVMERAAHAIEERL